LHCREEGEEGDELPVMEEEDIEEEEAVEDEEGGPGEEDEVSY
jgi:hypothetical protein